MGLGQDSSGLHQVMGINYCAHAFDMEPSPKGMRRTTLCSACARQYREMAFRKWSILPLPVIVRRRIRCIRAITAISMSIDTFFIILGSSEVSIIV